MMGALMVADATSDIMPYIISMDSATRSIDNGVWLLAGAFIAFAFAYFAVRWFL